MNMIYAIMFFALALQSIETPKYKLLQKYDNFEIRDYGILITAYTIVNEDFRTSTYTGFRRVANYIFGGNSKEMKIAMTAPVITQISEDNSKAHIIHFVMPSKHNLDTLPNPNLQNVNVHKESLGVVAVIKFGGWATEKRSNKFINTLLKELEENNIEVTGDIRVAQYDGPTTIPPFRKNEILIPVAVN